MTRGFPIRKLVVLLGLAAMAAVQTHAQYSNVEPSRWTVNGFAGFDLAHTSQSVANTDANSGQLFPLGDLRLNSDGFLLDPKFLHLNAGFDFQKGANTSERGDLGTGGINMSVGTAFLPNSHFPLRLNYTKSDHGVTGLGLDQNSDDSRLDVHWDVLLPKIPHLTFSFQDYGSTLHVPASFGDHSYSEKFGGVALNDSWKDWRWNGNFAFSEGSSEGVSPLSPGIAFDSSSRVGSFNLYRSFWDNKARLTFENREVWRNDHLGGDGASKSDEFADNVNFDLQVTPKVTVSSGYGFSRVDFESSAPSNVVLPGGGVVQVLSVSSGTAQTISGRLTYRPLNWLRVTQDVRTSFFTPDGLAAESRTSFTETASTIAAEHHLIGLDLSGSYTGRYQLTNTTLDNTPTSWSNGFTARVGWGNARNVRLTAVAENTRLNLVEQIGGFTDQKRLRGEAETSRLHLFRLRASADYTQVELLNLSGKVDSRIKTYAISAEQRRWTLGFSTSFTDGAGALFPEGLIDRQFLVIPLPINLLLNTPLLNRTTQANTLTFTGRLRRRLDVSFLWRTEDTKLASSEQTFDVIQAQARYHLGKFSLEGGYSRNLNDVTIITGLTGTRLSLWYFRIGRDFKIF